MPGQTADIDALFRLPLEEFTAARNALAHRLKASGDAEASSRVKALSKPPLSAWAVNQLYWRHRKAFDGLLAAGDRLRRAQASSLRAAKGGKGGGLRDAMEARRAALAELTTRAGALLEAAGHAPTPDVTRRLTTTLDALATYGHQSDGPWPGRLTDDVEAPGIEALAALVKGGTARGPGPSRVIPFAQRENERTRAAADPAAEKRRRDAERKRLAAAVRDAERALAGARKTAARAEAALKQAAARAKVAEQKKAELTARYEKLSSDADAARQDARRVAAQAEEAAQAVADAERAIEEARRTQQEWTDVRIDELTN
jgi:hypothetical protein